jgi:NAD+-dependent secondary alcohol dehydrogenase Adh1
MALAARGAVNLHTQKYTPADFQSAITDLDNANVRVRAIVTP